MTDRIKDLLDMIATLDDVELDEFYDWRKVGKAVKARRIEIRDNLARDNYKSFLVQQDRMDEAGMDAANAQRLAMSLYETVISGEDCAAEYYHNGRGSVSDVKGYVADASRILGKIRRADIPDSFFILGSLNGKDHGKVTVAEMEQVAVRLQEFTRKTG